MLLVLFPAPFTTLTVSNSIPSLLLSKVKKSLFNSVAVLQLSSTELFTALASNEVSSIGMGEQTIDVLNGGNEKLSICTQLHPVPAVILTVMNCPLLGATKAKVRCVHTPLIERGEVKILVPKALFTVDNPISIGTGPHEKGVQAFSQKEIL